MTCCTCYRLSWIFVLSYSIACAVTFFDSPSSIVLSFDNRNCIISQRERRSGWRSARVNLSGEILRTQHSAVSRCSETPTEVGPLSALASVYQSGHQPKLARCQQAIAPDLTGIENGYRPRHALGLSPHHLCPTLLLIDLID